MNVSCPWARQIRSRQSYNAPTALRAVIQRVSRAQVLAEGELVGNIGPGLLVLVAIAKDDGPAALDYVAQKVLGLRVFDDPQGKMNLSLGDTRGAILAVSQFTLFGDVRRGRRPAFDEAAPPELARPMYQEFLDRIRAAGVACESGRFQAKMQVELVNDGPVTILIDSKRKF